MNVITRFAPSPTGFLHIGGARTALFNYLFSKHHNGKFLLRIEDTDKKRSTQAAINAILNGLSWLNLNWDSNVVMQSSNLSLHQEVAHQLLQNGKAYYCYCNPKNNNEESIFSECSCSNNKSATKQASAAIRLKVNKVGFSTIHDLVAGKVSTPKKDIADFIILRQDGTPTYLLAATVDDINMKITHVIRGNDHLSNTFKQKEIYEALNKPLPIFAHIPLIHGADGNKLSKRHGALGIEEYKNMGYINTAINNYLLKLGWSFNNQDIISLSEAIDNFNIKNVQKSAARFDFNKLNSINFHYIKNSTNQQLLKLLQPFISSATQNKTLLPNAKDNLFNIIPFLKTRFKTLKDLANGSLFILLKDITISPAALEILKEKHNFLKEQLDLLLEEQNFTRENTHNIISKYSENKNIPLGKCVEPLRAAICGDISSPASVFDIINILGKKETIKRINNALESFQ